MHHNFTSVYMVAKHRCFLLYVNDQSYIKFFLNQYIKHFMSINIWRVHSCGKVTKVAVVNGIKSQIETVPSHRRWIFSLVQATEITNHMAN